MPAAGSGWLSLPFWLRYRVAYDHVLLTEIIAVWTRTVTHFYRDHARRQHGIADGVCAAISAVQRFGDGLRLNPHVHSIFADGVWRAAAGSDAPKFQRIKSPTQREVEVLTLAVRRRVLRRLGRLGVLRADLEEPSCDLFGEREPILASCMTASLLDRVAIGERKGELVMRLRDEQVEVRGNGKRCAVADGFNVHAATTVPPLARDALERLCKYLLRPAICNERLQRLESGEVLLTLRKRWSDGTFAKVFQPQDLISKVIALLPAPGANLLRFHGQFAPGARWRAQITAGAARARKATAPPKDEEQRQRRMAWSVLLRRSFAIEVMNCPACGGRRELLAVIEHKPTVQKILAHLGLDTEPPAFALPRGPPLLAGKGVPDADGLPWEARDAGRRVVVDPGFVEPAYD
ncbi:MAG: transposase [Deltaproteobacteria bacterium]|nr:transposase [Deltaproteobacteria bacterium]